MTGRNHELQSRHHDARKPPSDRPARAFRGLDTVTAWMKVELELPDKPEVYAIATRLALDPEVVPTKLIKVWAWFDRHTTDGNARGVTKSLVDSKAGVIGFADAMESVCWLSYEDGVLSLPKFDRHNGQTAKNRALTGQRVASYKQKRSANDDGNDPIVTTGVTKTVPRLDKRKIEEQEESKDAEAPAAPADGGPADLFPDGPPPPTSPAASKTPEEAKRLVRDRIWSVGVSLFDGHGKSQATIRSGIGGLCRDYGDDVTLIAILQCEALGGMADPMAWLIATCKATKASRSAAPKASRHVGLSDKNYREGAKPDGTL